MSWLAPRAYPAKYTASPATPGEVLEGVAHGLSNRLIGERLRISPRTVEIHRANMLHKIGVTHTNEAIRIAIEASLVA